VAAALDEAHAQGLIHRDVKTANLLVAEGRTPRESAGHVYLSDFGLTKYAMAGSGFTGTGQFIGSIEYAAPEQFQGKELDPRTDVYALGCVVFECLTGRTPFHRDSEAAVLYAHLSEPPPSIVATRPELPDDVDDVAAKAMAKEPGDRYERCGDLAAGLREVVAGGVGPSRRGHRAVPAARHRPVTAATPAAAATGRTRRRALAIPAGATAVVLAVVAIVLVASRGATPPVHSPGPSSPTLPGPAVPVFLGRAAVRIDPTTNKAGKLIPLPGGSNFVPDIAVGEGAVWTTSNDGLTHVDPERGVAENTVANPPDVAPGWIIFAANDVWAGYTNFDGTTSIAVVRVDPATDKVIKEIPLRYVTVHAAVPLAAIGGFVWAPNGPAGMTRIDPGTNRADGTFPLPGAPLDMVAADGSLWIVYTDVDELSRVDPKSGRFLAHIPLQNPATAVAAGSDAVWVVSNVQGIATKVDTSTNEVADNVAVGGTPSDIGVGEDGTLWVSLGSGEVVHVDPNTRKLVTIRFVGHLDHLAVTSTDVWVVGRP